MFVLIAISSVFIVHLIRYKITLENAWQGSINLTQSLAGEYTK